MTTQRKITPERLADAVERLGNSAEAQALAGDWARLSGLAAQIRTATDDKSRRSAGLELVDWLSDHRSVQDLVHLELTVLDELREALRQALAAAADRLHLSVADVDAYVEAVLRGVQPELAPGTGAATRQVFLTPEKATLVHIRNVWLHPGELLEFLGSAVFTANDLLNQPNGILLGFGLLWLVRTLYKLATEDITGVDAAVLWGAWHACGRTDGQAPLHRILEEANKAASAANLPFLTEQAVIQCLNRLQKLGIVEPAQDDVWFLRKKCRDHPLG